MMTPFYQGVLFLCLIIAYCEGECDTSKGHFYPNPHGPDCPQGTSYDNKIECCTGCPVCLAGQRKKEKPCTGCLKCPSGSYSDEENSEHCMTCTDCESELNRQTQSICTSMSDTDCGCCLNGYYENKTTPERGGSKRKCFPEIRKLSELVNKSESKETWPDSAKAAIITLGIFIVLLPIAVSIFFIMYFRLWNISTEISTKTAGPTPESNQTERNGATEISTKTAGPTPVSNQTERNGASNGPRKTSCQNQGHDVEEATGFTPDRNVPSGKNYEVEGIEIRDVDAKDQMRSLNVRLPPLKKQGEGEMDPMLPNNNKTTEQASGEESDLDDDNKCIPLTVCDAESNTSQV